LKGALYISKALQSWRRTEDYSHCRACKTSVERRSVNWWLCDDTKL